MLVPNRKIVGAGYNAPIFITIKQGAYVRYTSIRIRRYLYIFSARTRVIPSPTTVSIALYS
jgi:hypothetical protein